MSDIPVSQLIVNKLTKEQLLDAIDRGLIKEDEVYVVTDPFYNEGNNISIANNTISFVNNSNYQTDTQVSASIDEIKPRYENIDPTVNTEAKYLGQNYINTTTKDVFQCVAINEDGIGNKNYIWKKIAENAILTIQKNGVNVGTFSANQSTNETINIEIPTSASDIGALPSTTKYATNISLSLDPETFIITIQLKDQDGNNIGNARTIDLPLESVVVGGSYDDETKKIILILQNGSTVEIPVADLVGDFQPKITDENKLDADLVDDSNSSNKFVTVEEINEWSSKQDALIQGNGIIINTNEISVDPSIISGATAGATAVQPEILAAVATTGSFNSLTDQPFIPETASDVDALPNTTKYGYSLNTQNKTLTLLDQDGNTLSTQTIPWMKIRRIEDDNN